MSERDGFTSRYETAKGCLSVLALPFYALVKIPFILAAEARRYELESMLAEEKIPARELAFLESEFHAKVERYAGGMYKLFPKISVPLIKGIREYDPKSWLEAFFTLQKVYRCDDELQAQILELEQAVRYDAYYQILERKGIAERAEKKVRAQKNE